jgi:hypothetical protein
MEISQAMPRKVSEKEKFFRVFECNSLWSRKAATGSFVPIVLYTVRLHASWSAPGLILSIPKAFLLRYYLGKIMNLTLQRFIIRAA